MKPSGSSIPVARIQPLVEIGLDDGPALGDAAGPTEVDAELDAEADPGAALVVGWVAKMPAGVPVGVMLPQAATSTATRKIVPSREAPKRRGVDDTAGLRT